MMPFHVIERVKNMTRETKLGLVVSCSFLGLLGAVLVMKMTGRPEDEQGPEVAAAAQPERSPPAVPPNNGGKPAPAPAAKAAPTKAAPPQKSNEPPKLPNLDNGIVLTKGTPPPPVSHPKEENSGPPPMSPPAATGDDLPPIPTATPSPAPAAPPAVTSAPPPTSGGGFLSSLWGKVKGTTLAAARHVPKKKPAPGDGDKPVAKADLPPVPGEGGSEPPAAVPPLPPVTPPVLPPAPVPTDEKKTDPPPPAAPPLPPITPAPDGTRGTTSSGERLRPIPAAPPPSVDPPVKPAPATPTIDVPPVTPKPSPPVKGPDPIAVGRAPAAAVPAMPVPAVPAVRAAQPEVVSYTEETYTANAGDTFQSISQAKYGTDAYARALYLFNRGHPLAGDELLRSDALKPKQPVYIPPAAILRSRYPEAVGGAKAAGVSVGSTSRRANGTPRTYRVAAGGEKVYDIASRQLGDGNRWVEIRDLNPGWNPELPIPAGTTLNMPSDARAAQ